MANGKVVIEIISSGGGDEKKPISPINSSSLDKINDSIEQVSTEEDFDFIDALSASKTAAIQAGKVAKQIVNSTIGQTVLWGVEKQLSLKEDYLGENTLNQIKGNISALKQYASGAVDGAQAGARLGGKLGGPYGAAIGALIGGTAGVATTKWKTDVEWRKKQMEYQQQLNETNLQTSFQATRLGLIDGSQGTLN